MKTALMSVGPGAAQWLAQMVTMQGERKRDRDNALLTCTILDVL